MGLTLPQLGEFVTRAAVRTFCERSELLGFSSLWVQEHLLFALEPSAPYAARPGLPVPMAYQSTFSPLELLSAAAAWTNDITLGTGILVGGYHRPVELAQRLATLDHLCEGRLVAGLSVGWSKDEHEQMDVDFHTRGKRMDELVEALVVCWGPDPVQFEGEFFSIPPSIIRPKPVQQPHPPLLSGMRSQRGLIRTAALFDIWNPASGTIPSIIETRAKIDEMREASQKPIIVKQRIFTEPPFLAPGLAPMSIEQMTEAVLAARDAGIDEVIIDSAFSTQVQSSQDWAGFPDQLASIVDALAD